MHGGSGFSIVCQSQTPLCLNGRSKSRELCRLFMHPSVVTEGGLAWGSLLGFQCSLHCRCMVVTASATISRRVVPCGKPSPFSTELSLTSTGKAPYRVCIADYMVQRNQFVRKFRSPGWASQLSIKRLVGLYVIELD